MHSHQSALSTGFIFLYTFLFFMHNTYHIKYTGQKEITTLKIPPALLTGGIYFL